MSWTCSAAPIVRRTLRNEKYDFDVHQRSDSRQRVERLDGRRLEQALVAGTHHDRPLRRASQDRLGILAARRERFFHVDMTSGVDRQPRQRRVRRRRCHDVHDVRLDALQQLGRIGADLNAVVDEIRDRRTRSSAGSAIPTSTAPGSPRIAWRWCSPIFPHPKSAIRSGPGSDCQSIEVVMRVVRGKCS